MVAAGLVDLAAALAVVAVTMVREATVVIVAQEGDSEVMVMPVDAVDAAVV